MLIAGTPLEPQCYNAGRNTKREGLRNLWIGQSAAKNINVFKSADFKKKILTNLFIFWAVCSTASGGYVVLEMKDNSGLFPLAQQVRENISNKISGNAISPSNSVGDPAGRQITGINAFAGKIGNVFNWLLIAHHNFGNSAILASNWASDGIEFFNPKATFAVHKSGDISSINIFHTNSLNSHVNVQRLESDLVGSSDPKSMASSIIYYNEEGDIVFSSSKDEAAGRRFLTSVQERKYKPYMGDEYFGIAHPTTWRGMKNDLESVYQYRDEGFQMIYNGEIGKFEGVRFIEQNNVTKAQFGTFTTNSQSNGAFFFGEDTVAEAIVVPEEIRGAIPTDYGRSKGIAWYYLGGFALTQTAAQQSRIVKWDSAS